MFRNPGFCAGILSGFHDFLGTGSRSKVKLTKHGFPDCHSAILGSRDQPSQARIPRPLRDGFSNGATQSRGLLLPQLLDLVDELLLLEALEEMHQGIQVGVFQLIESGHPLLFSLKACSNL